MLQLVVCNIIENCSQLAGRNHSAITREPTRAWAVAQAPLFDVFGCAKQSRIFPYAKSLYSMLTSSYMGNSVHDARQGGLRRKSTI